MHQNDDGKSPKRKTVMESNGLSSGFMNLTQDSIKNSIPLL